MPRVKDGLKNKVSERTVHEVVSGQRDKLMTDLTREVNAIAQKEFGIKVVDVRVKRVDFPTSTSESIYNRMRTEREREAREHRSQGTEIAETIKAKAQEAEVERERTRNHAKMKVAQEKAAAAAAAGAGATSRAAAPAAPGRRGR